MKPRTTLQDIKATLGNAAFEGDGFLIYHGDCVEYLKQLEDAIIPLAVTSPPYNIGKEYESVKKMEDYLAWCVTWIDQLYRISSDKGAFWLNLGYVPLEGKAKAIPIPYLLWDRIPFFLLQEVVWNYSAGVATKHTFSPRNEKFLWYVKNSRDYVFDLDAVRDPNVKYPNQKKNGKLRCNPLGKNPSDVWQIPKVTSGRNRSSKERTPHPAQFPIALIERIIKACSEKGDVVVDPFLGSGSTIEAALRAGRTAIGFEIKAAYVEIAAERAAKAVRSIEAEEAQASLF